MARPVLLAIAFGLLAGTAAARPPVRVEVRGERGNRSTVTFQVRLPANIVATWGTLTDFRHHARFVPYLRRSRVVRQTLSHTVVDQEAAIRVLGIPFRLRMRQRFEEDPFTDLRFAALGGDFERLSGRCRLTPHDEDLTTTLACRVDVAPKRWVPTWVVRIGAKRFLPPILEALGKHAASL